MNANQYQSIIEAAAAVVYTWRAEGDVEDMDHVIRGLQSALTAASVDIDAICE